MRHIPNTSAHRLNPRKGRESHSTGGRPNIPRNQSRERELYAGKDEPHRRSR
jgi:hypothetical protein